jgi:AmmeMemoRadiSam system protein B/AmmeMemoRadiSam system protein A
MMKQSFSGIRHAAVAGMFYPADPGRLARDVDAALARGMTVDSRERACAAIVPHAGYTYSGGVAGKAYARLQLRDDLSRIVVLATSHEAAFRGISTGAYEGFATPLGVSDTDISACRTLLGAGRPFTPREDVFDMEHALEVQLPFIQSIAPDVPIVPLLCGGLRTEEIEHAGRVLAEELWDDTTAWVVSSDFTHFGADFGYAPFDRDVQQRIRELDGGAVERILARDARGFRAYVQETGATICGADAIGVLLSVLSHTPAPVRGELVDYTTSGLQTGDERHSVSYAAIVFSLPPAERDTEGNAAAGLTDKDKQTLLQVARSAIRAEVTDASHERPPDDRMSDILCRPAACFVTLHLDERLRGCIGTLEAREPLVDCVARYARNAACRDPRFNPLTEAELARVEIEISVLTPARPVSSPEAIEIGRHGIILEKGGRRAVYLPQVATEQGWDRETALSHLAMKAGLNPDDWRREACFSVFEAEVFGESDES